MIFHFFFRSGMIAKRFVGDWQWVPKMIIWRKSQRQNRHESQAFTPDYKKVLIAAIFFLVIKSISFRVNWVVVSFIKVWIYKFVSWTMLQPPPIQRAQARTVKVAQNYRNQWSIQIRRQIFVTAQHHNRIHTMLDHFLWKRALRRTKKVSITIFYSPLSVSEF